MDSRLQHLLRKHNLEVDYLPIKGQGYIITTPKWYPDILAINERLSEQQAEKVILHEIGHATDSPEIGDYKTNYSTRITSEDKANCYMVQQMIKKYADLGNDIESANWLDLAKSIGTNKYKLVKRELEKYCE